jgi:hypothetical protein
MTHMALSKEECRNNSDLLIRSCRINDRSSWLLMRSNGINSDITLTEMSIILLDVDTLTDVYLLYFLGFAHVH